MLYFGLTACSAVPTQQKKIPSNYLQDFHPNTYLEKKLSPSVKQHPNKTGFFLVANGIDAFAIRTALIEKAESRIDVQYYMIHEDQSGRAFFNALKQAANRGVKVRLLIDDIHLINESTFLKDADAHPNIEVRVFNAFNRRIPRFIQYVYKLGKISRRMHVKSLTIDNQISIVGGRNIADEYFQHKLDVNFSDMDAVFIGSLVEGVSKNFDDFWNSKQVTLLANLMKIPKSTKPIRAKQKGSNFIDDAYYIKALDQQKFPFFWADAELIADAPTKITKKRDMQKFVKGTKIGQIIDRTEKEILIFTPYLVPTKAGMNHLKELRQKGIKIILLTNSLSTTDVPFVHSGYINYRRDLVRLGVELYELKTNGSPLELFKQHSKGKKVKAKKDSLHAKVMVFDRKRFYVGSMNIDPRSVYENPELGLVIESPVVAESLYNWFDRNVDKLAYKVDVKDLVARGETTIWQDGKKNILIKEPGTRLLGRVWMDFLSGLPIAEKHL